MQAMSEASQLSHGHLASLLASSQDGQELGDFQASWPTGVPCYKLAGQRVSSFAREHREEIDAGALQHDGHRSRPVHRSRAD